jgi:hypothetical protein
MRMRKCQKRPIIWQKRPIAHTKETYRYIDIPEVHSDAAAPLALSDAPQTRRQPLLTQDISGHVRTRKDI